jgi:hypothetical protein
VCQAVKSLAGNDDAKKQVQEHAVFGSVLHTLLRFRCRPQLAGFVTNIDPDFLVRFRSAGDALVAEAACGAIGALCLRHPENSHRSILISIYSSALFVVSGHSVAGGPSLVDSFRQISLAFAGSLRLPEHSLPSKSVLPLPSAFVFAQRACWHRCVV